MREAAKVLGRVRILQDLDTADIDALMEQLRLANVRRGSAIYCQGEPADGLHIILAGKVKLCRHADDGRERLLDVRGPAEILGTVSVLDHGPRTATAIAFTDVWTAQLDTDTLRMWMAERPTIADKMLRLLAARLRRADVHLIDMVFDDVPGRVAKELLDLARRFGTQQGDLWHVQHDLTQAEIAHLVGAARESVNKALCEFAQRGWITLDGKITLIHRPERLARRAG